MGFYDKITGKASVVAASGIHSSAPISFKVPKKQSDEAKQVVCFVKKYYLCV